MFNRRMSMPPIPKPTNILMAEMFYDHFQIFIRDSQNNLKDDEELQVIFYDQAGNLYILQEVGYYNPSLIMLYGKKPDEPGVIYEILVHMNSFQIFLKISKKIDEKPRSQIGFLGNLQKSDPQGQG